MHGNHRRSARRAVRCLGSALALIVATALAACLGQPPSERTGTAAGGAVERLGWMAGCWERRTATIHAEEIWMTPRGGTMLGMSRTIRDGRTVGYESLRIEERGGRLVYVASPSTQATTEFTATAASDTLAAFENPAHDFPQRILYRPGRGDSLWARIEGEVEGDERAVDFRLARSECG